MKKPKIQKILVPIDFSGMSIQAIETAKSLARRFAAQIHFVHVQNEMYSSGCTDLPGPIVMDHASAIQRENKKRLEDLRALAARHNFLPKNCYLITGMPAFEAICRKARELAIDLIVMPTHGRTGLKHVFLGSTAERVIQHGPCPVFVVRSKRTQVREILVPVDFSASSLRALRYAIRFARLTAAKVVVLHSVYLSYVFTSDGYAMYDLTGITDTMQKSAERDLAKFVNAAKFDGVDFETVVNVGDAAEEICRFAKEREVDLIIMATHGRTGFAHVLMGSVAEKIVRHGDRPVLVVPSRLNLADRIRSKQRRPVGCNGCRSRKSKCVPASASRREVRLQVHASAE